MKTTFLTAAVMAAVLAPAAASAQTSRGELYRDRVDIRQEQRDLGRAVRSGDRRDIRDEREDLREARREYREDLNDRYGSHHRHGTTTRIGYVRFNPGYRIDARYWAPTYRVAYNPRWRLASPARHQVYVRHHHDLLLVNTRTNRVVQVHRGYYR